jgi:hypothetical protein
MPTIKFFCSSVLSIILVLTGGACSNPTAYTQEDSSTIAKAFVKADATYAFDGMPETLQLMNTAAVENGWQFICEFDSRHAGYGDRNGQMLAQVITHHAAVITVQKGEVTSGVMDWVWDMIKQQLIEGIEISPAPIHEANVTILMSKPPQVEVYIKGGLADGCTTFHNIEVAREGSHVNITVTVQHPKDVSCPAIYTYFEKFVILGSDFTAGVTYTLEVNDFSTTFPYFTEM